jgi:hypothetical protein
MKRIIVSLLLLIAFQVSKAQYYYDRSKNPDKNVVTTQKVGQDFDKYFFFNWDINKPLSNTDFISQQSSIGTRFGFRKRINDEDKLWVGGDLSWAVYKEYFPYATYPSNNGALSTDLYNYSYNYALTVNIDYLLRPKDKILVPYGGLGIGVAYDKFAQYYNVYGGTGDSWGLILRPEAGVLVGFGASSAWRIKVAAHYDYATNKNADFGYNGFTNFGIQFGIVKMAW